MEIHLVFLPHAAFPKGFPRKFARCGSETGLFARSHTISPWASYWDRKKRERTRKENERDEGGARRIKGSFLILRPKRFPSVDYVALLQLAIRSLCLLAIRDIAEESDHAFCLDGQYRVSSRCQCEYIWASCLVR